MKFETKLNKLGINEEEVKSIIANCECGEINGAYFIDLSTMRKWEIMEMIGNHLDTDLYSDGDFYTGNKRMSSFCKTFGIEESQITDLYVEALNEWGYEVAYTLESNKDVVLVLTDDERYTNSFIQYSPSQTEDEEESEYLIQMKSSEVESNVVSPSEALSILKEKSGLNFTVEKSTRYYNAGDIIGYAFTDAEGNHFHKKASAGETVLIDTLCEYANCRVIRVSAEGTQESKLDGFIVESINNENKVENMMEFSNEQERKSVDYTFCYDCNHNRGDEECNNCTYNDDELEESEMTEEKYVDFKIISKEDSRIYLNGTFDVNSYDENTDMGDWEYEQNDGTFKSHIPNYWKRDGENLSFEFEEFLDCIDWEMFRQWLFDCQDESRSIDCGDYILHINYGACVEMDIVKHDDFEESFCATLLFRYNCKPIDFDENIIKDLAEALAYDDEFRRVTSNSSIIIELPKGFSDYVEDTYEGQREEVISEMTQTVREHFARQLIHQAEIHCGVIRYCNQNDLQEEIASDRETMFQFKCAIDDTNVGNWLIDNCYLQEE